MKNAIYGALVMSGLMMAAAPAYAASDYLLTFEGVDGEAKPASIEVQSWSFGASQSATSSSTGMASGKRMHKPYRMEPVEEDRQVTVVTAREAGSGMATGKSSCPSGKHFAKVVLQDMSRHLTLTDVTVSACTADGMTLSFTQPAKSTPVTRSNISNN